MGAGASQGRVPAPGAGEHARGFRPVPPGEIEQTIPERFAKVAASCGSLPVLDLGESRLGYAELDAASDRVAARVLAESGAEPTRVALIFQRPAALLAALLGALKAGHVYVPVDPGLPARRVQYILDDADASLVLRDGGARAPWEESLPAGRKVVDVEGLLGAAGSEAGAGPSKLEGGRARSPRGVAALFYTSGSTGEPKGVMRTHRDLLQHVRNYINCMELAPGDRVAFLFSYSFAGSIPDLYGALLSGATLCPFDVRSRGTDALVRWVAEARISLLHLVPTLFRDFVSHLRGDERFPALLRVDLSGEPAHERDADAFRVHFDAPCRLVNRLAATEAGILTRHVVDHATPSGRGVLPVGRPFEGTEILIVDEREQVLPEGEVGEIVVRGPFLSPGYWGRPELAAGAFRDEPGREGWRCYRTGDRGRIRPDGLLEHLGRLDARVNIRGFSVELGEVESALRTLPGVRDAAVATREERSGRASLVAWVVHDGAARPTPATLRRALRDLLPDYMVPAAFGFTEALPRTPSGKLDRRALPERRPGAVGDGAERVAPRSALEARLAQIWRQELRLDELGVTDDFFELGGDSLSAVQVIHRIEEELGERLAPSALVTAPSIGELAAQIEAGESRESLLIPFSAAGGRMPFFCSAGVGGDPIHLARLAGYLDPDQPFYGLRTHGVSGHRPPARSIPEMARAQLEEILGVQPRGPYILGGYSFGCTVAYELAQQLRARGEQVAMLVMLDGWAPGYPQLSPGRSLALRALDRLVGRWVVESRRTRLARLLPRIGRAARQELRYVLRRWSGRPPTREDRRHRHKMASVRARWSYSPGPWPGRITLFLASGRSIEPGLVPEPLLGWKDYARDGVEVCRFATAHKELLHEPEVREVARALQDCIEQATQSCRSRAEA